MRRRRAQALLAATLAAGTAVLVGTRQDAASEATVVQRHAVPRPPQRVQRPLQTIAPRRPHRRVDVYAFDRRGMLSGAARGVPPRIYVPNSLSGSVDEIDPRTLRVVRRLSVGSLPQHVTPSYDLRTLYVDNDASNTLTPLDPRTGAPRGRPVPVADPYNLYFTTDGRYAIVVAERLQRLDFRAAHSLRLHRSLILPCPGVDHLDFTADGRRLLASCEFDSRLVVVDVRRERLLRSVALPSGAVPQDVKLSPDGRVFYVADTSRGGVWIVDARSFRVRGLLATGAGAHGLYPSRDARFLYVTNRLAGTVSVVSFRTRRVVRTWRVGGSPDMGGVSADGATLWVSSRYDGHVLAIDTHTGRVRARIAVGAGPHGVCVWPQPGRYSLGHTGVLR